MFNKKERMTLITRTENGDYLRYEKLISTWKESNTLVETRHRADNYIVEIEFTLNSVCKKGFIRDVNLLNFIGIEGCII